MRAETSELTYVLCYAVSRLRNYLSPPVLASWKKADHDEHRPVDEANHAARHHEPPENCQHVVALSLVVVVCVVVVMLFLAARVNGGHDKGTELAAIWQ